MSNVSRSDKFGGALSLVGGVVIPAVAMADFNGNTVRTSDAGVGDGTAFLGGAVVLATIPQAAYTAAQSPVTFSTAGITYLAVDTTVVSFQGGTSPTIQFLVDRLGADSVWYNVWSGQTSGSPITQTFDLGPGFATAGPPNGSQHAVFTLQARLRWAYAGSPTTVTFSGSVIGR